MCPSKKCPSAESASVKLPFSYRSFARERSISVWSTAWDATAGDEMKARKRQNKTARWRKPLIVALTPAPAIRIVVKRKGFPNPGGPESQSGTVRVHHFFRLETYAHGLIRNLAGELHVRFIIRDGRLARRSGFGKEKDGILNRSLRVFFIGDMSGRNFLFSLFHLKERSVLEKLFVVLSEGRHVRHAQDKLILRLGFGDIFVNVHSFAMQDGLARRSRAHDAGRLPKNLDVQFSHGGFALSHSTLGCARARHLPDAAVDLRVGCNILLRNGKPGARNRGYAHPW